jgi:hypothetical protein
MACKCPTALPVCLAMVGILLTTGFAVGRETEAQLLQQIQSEQNPVRKAKDEIKLANLKLAQVKEAYAQGHMEEGVKLLGALTDALKASWKILQDSGRTASKQPEGFKELEIALREDVRVLQDLGRTVTYLDRPPLEKVAQDLEQMRSEVIHAQFPGRPPRTLKNPPPPPADSSPRNPDEGR